MRTKTNCVNYSKVNSLTLTKTERAKALLSAGDFIGALAIIRTFRLGFSKEERRSIEIAYESLNGHDKFYRSLGIDTGKEIKRTRQLLADKYL